MPPPAHRYLLDQHLFKRADRRKVSEETAQQFIKLNGIFPAFSLGHQERERKDAMLDGVVSRPAFLFFSLGPGRQLRVQAIC